MRIVRTGFKTIDLEDCEIVSRNFEGAEVKRNGRIMNNAGMRNFLLLLDPDAAQEMEAAGWRVKYFAKREDEDEAQAFIKVNVSYRNTPPIVHYISDKVDTRLDEDRIKILDDVNIEMLDIRLNGSARQDDDGTWRKTAYLDEMWATVTPDRFASKYANLRDGYSEDDEDDVSVF